MDWDALKFAWDGAILLLGNLVALGMIVAFLAFVATILLYLAREQIARLRKRREAKMWSQVGDILEEHHFDDEEGGDRCLIQV